jgi:molybdopterin synthase catalytic subunit
LLLATQERAPALGFGEVKRIAGTLMTTIRLQRQPFDVAAEVERMTHGRADIGAVVTFTGLCRADENGKPIAALTLEHYPGMAEAEIGRHVEEAYARWPLLGVTVIHRFGRLEPGDVIVLVATASSHREAAFAAASFLMDYLKTRAPFWKQVESADDKTGGEMTGGDKTGGEKTWVEAKASDDTAAERWSAPPPRHEAAK